MNIIKFVVAFLVVQCSDIVYNNLKIAFLNKIAVGDYCFLNNESRYLCVMFNFHLRKNAIKAGIKITTFPWHFEESEYLIVDMENKSIDNILKKFEEKLFIKYKKKAADAIILIYRPNNCRTNAFYKRIIKRIEKINDERKEMHIRPDIIYKYIIGIDSLWYRMTKVLRDDLELYGVRIDYKIPLYIEENTEGIYLVISIQLDNIYYCFEIDVKELDRNLILSLVEFEPPHEDESHDLISRLFCDLYAFVSTDDIGSLHPSRFSVCELNKIEFFENKIQMGLECEKLCLTINTDNFKYILRKKVGRGETKLFIYEKTYLEFQGFFKKIYAIEQMKEKENIIELFYRLMSNNNQVLYLLNRILDKTSTVLNIIFKYLIDCQNIINKNELELTIGKKQRNKTERQIILEALQDIFSRGYKSSSTYLIKICLLLEAEELINKNDVFDEPIFGTLKRITELVPSQENSMNIISSEDNINLCKAYQYLIKNCLADIKIYKRNIWKVVYKFAALFTGLEKTECIAADYYYYIVKSNEIANLGLGENEVTKNYDTVSKKILEKHLEDIKKENLKYFYNIKNIIESISHLKMSEEEIKIKRSEITTLLNKINIKIHRLKLMSLKNEALNANIENLYDEKTRTKFENDLRERGREEITNIYIGDIETHELIKFIDKYDKNILLEYNDNILITFFAELSAFIDKNTKRSCERDLPRVSVSLIENSLNNEAFKQYACEKILRRMVNILGEIGILKSLNKSGITLHDDLVKTIKDKEE
ncbi:uncharacterized protein VNE69_01001 [Vairimorpha necatrix]|uniref:Uncharacterized protein n=1 Tax=Vairimorpha necatrix TaxID=6039 RepID=A0AAX4J7L8_9MICR